MTSFNKTVIGRVSADVLLNICDEDVVDVYTETKTITNKRSFLTIGEIAAPTTHFFFKILH